MNDYVKQEGLLYPQVPLEEWAQLHRLVLEPCECPFCGAELQPQVPFATKKSRGYQYEQCKCPDYPKDQAPTLWAAADPKERAKDVALFEQLYEAMKGENL